MSWLTDLPQGAPVNRCFVSSRASWPVSCSDSPNVAEMLMKQTCAPIKHRCPVSHSGDCILCTCSAFNPLFCTALVNTEMNHVLKHPFIFLHKKATGDKKALMNHYATNKSQKGKRRAVTYCRLGLVLRLITNSLRNHNGTCGRQFFSFQQEVAEMN